jgi:hypothetical protein
LVTTARVHLALSLFARLEALNRRIPTPPQCQIDPLQHDVVDFETLLERDLVEGSRLSPLCPSSRRSGPLDQNRETQIPGLPSGSYFHSALFAVLIHSMALGYFCASARIKFDDEQFAALFNELQARGDKQKLMQLFGH